MTIHVQLGATIRQLRVRKGLSQEELAHRCGIHRSHMGVIERGQANITLATLELIAHEFEMRPAELLQEPIAS